jgi:hypothetical protein
MALAHNSGGLCYYQDRSEPVLRKVENQWRFIVEIAHIRAAEEGGPHSDKRMTVDQRRGFSNIMPLLAPALARRPSRMVRPRARRNRLTDGFARACPPARGGTGDREASASCSPS